MCVCACACVCMCVCVLLGLRRQWIKRSKQLDNMGFTLLTSFIRGGGETTAKRCDTFTEWSSIRNCRGHFMVSLFVVLHQSCPWCWIAAARQTATTLWTHSFIGLSSSDLSEDSGPDPVGDWRYILYSGCCCGLDWAPLLPSQHSRFHWEVFRTDLVLFLSWQSLPITQLVIHRGVGVPPLLWLWSPL